MGKNKTAPETESALKEHQPSVVSSTDGAKLIKNIDIAIDEFKNKSNAVKTFIGDLAKQKIH